MQYQVISRESTVCQMECIRRKKTILFVIAESEYEWKRPQLLSTILTGGLDEINLLIYFSLLYHNVISIWLGSSCVWMRRRILRIYQFTRKHVQFRGIASSRHACVNLFKCVRVMRSYRIKYTHIYIQFFVRTFLSNFQWILNTKL